MARGQDTSKHEGRRVGRETPRIAAALAGYLNQKMEDSSEQLLESNPMLYYSTAGNPGYIDEEQGQHLIDRYRQTREIAQRVVPRPRGRLQSQWPDTAAADAENIRQAIRWYRNEQGLG